MVQDLFDLGMCKGQMYELILTTWNSDNTRNAAPFGTIVKDSDVIVNRIFEGSETLENIKRNGNFVVNLTYNPLYFTYSMIDNINEDQYRNNDSLVLKGVDAYFSASVDDIRVLKKKDDPIRPVDTCYIRSTISNVVINDKISLKPMNRGIHCVIESLVNFSRVDKVDSEMREYYFSRFKENMRVVRKVGSKDDKIAMNYIFSKLESMGYFID